MGEVRSRGVVKWFSNAKGYGFVTLSDGSKREIFVHFTAIQVEGYKKLAEGDVVECDVERGEKGLRAANVTVLEQAAKDVPHQSISD